MVAERQPLEAVHGESMRQVHAKPLIIDLFGGTLVLWLRLVLLLRTFGEDQIVTALVNNAGAHWKDTKSSVSDPRHDSKRSKPKNLKVSKHTK